MQVPAYVAGVLGVQPVAYKGVFEAVKKIIFMPVWAELAEVPDMSMSISILELEP